MDWLEFISSIVGSLAWPVAVLLAMYALRKPLAALLLKVSRLKYADLEIDFGKGLKQLRDAAKIAAVGKSGNDKSEARKAAFTEEIEKVSETSRLAAISLAWSKVEAQIYRISLRTGGPGGALPSSSPYTNLKSLKDRGILREADFDLLDGMRKLRNEVEHAHLTEADIKPEQAREYGELAASMTDKLSGIATEDANKSLKPPPSGSD